ncbi:MAG: hypothetical protein JWM53_335 [bacterium]|nr:hypothetical protein [bacterium]
MKYKLEDYLRVSLPLLPPVLASPAAIASMRALSRELPPTADFGFESRLDRDEAALDLFARIRGGDGSRRAYAGLNPHVAVPDQLLAHGAWRQLRAFCARWHDARDRFFDTIGDMWLELDSAVLADERPTPCIFFSLRARGRDGAAVAEDGCRTLFGDPRFALGTTMRRCFEALPGRGWVEHVGLMLSRPERPLRLVIVGLPPDELFGALAELGWAGDLAALRRYQASLGDLVSGYALAVDVGERLRPRVGIEWYLGDMQPPKVEAFLSRCIALRLARPEKAAALARWHGLVKRGSSDDYWPANLAAGETQLGLRSTFNRQINHFKLVYADGTAPEMKAYFGLSHLWVRPIEGAQHESSASA